MATANQNHVPVNIQARQYQAMKKAEAAAPQCPFDAAIAALDNAAALEKQAFSDLSACIKDCIAACDNAVKGLATL